MKSKKEEINMIGNLQKQNEEFKNQVKKINSELESAKAKISALNEEKMKLEQHKIESDMQIKWYEAQTDRDYKNDMVNIQKKRTDIEIGQLRDGNPYNDQIKMQ